MANALNKVNSGGIEDGSIVNADVKSDAAIAGSKLVAATTSVPGSMSAADKTKLDGIATSATANPSAPALTGSTDNTITTVTGANAIQGEANLTFDGSKLTVQGDNGLVVQTETAASSDTDPVGEIFFNNSSNGNVNAKIVTFRKSGTSGGDLAFFTRTHGDGSNPEGLERLRIHSDGDVEVKTGNLVIGTSGKGIDFSAQTPSSATGATTDSEVLDHYEEGTWTPTYEDAGGSITVSGYDYQQGNYTKIGNHVYIQARLRTSGITVDSSGTYDLGGLPFTTKNTDANGLFICALQSGWNDAPHQFTVNINATTARAREGMSVGDGAYTNSDTNGFNETAGDKNRTYIMGSYLAA